MKTVGINLRFHPQHEELSQPGEESGAVDRTIGHERDRQSRGARRADEGAGVPAPDAAACARRIVSVCTGAFVMAPTGLLDGRRVTTHWHHAHKLAMRYPKILMEKERIFIKDGNVYTTAGVTAGIDMALSIVEEDFGHKMVALIAHTLVLYMRRPGSEVQYSRMLAQQESVGGTPMRDLSAWAKANLAQNLGVNVLAKIVAMTPRTFARRFEAHFNMTPARWIQALRVESVCEHLSAGDLPLKVVAALTGFSDEKSLRRAFVQHLAITPKEYRERFGLSRGRSPLPSPRGHGLVEESDVDRALPTQAA